MTARRGWHLRRRDLRFLGVVALNLACVAGYLATESGAPTRRSAAGAASIGRHWSAGSSRES